LPHHAQVIFRQAFNHAFETYGGDETRAFRVAWAAVKRAYQKVGGEWIPRRSRPSPSPFERGEHDDPNPRDRS
jgi:cation transport regulator